MENLGIFFAGCWVTVEVDISITDNNGDLILGRNIGIGISENDLSEMIEWFYCFDPGRY
ncbi:MAG: hypothetical protein MUP22_07245 [Desulfobacterales bacterium]|nr:hypothetical protein [Desulfobacterales bacterium]